MTEDARTRASNNDGSVSGQPLRVALYARVSTVDKHQDPEMQLAPLREHAERLGWEVTEYVDKASASNFTGRSAWKRFVKDAEAGKLDLLAVWALDRAFRDTRHCLNTLYDLKALGVSFFSLTQKLDTSDYLGQFILEVMAAVASMEKGQVSARVREGLVNARRRGARLGRPPVTDRPGFGAEWKIVKAQLDSGDISKRAAARRLGVAPTTLINLLETVPRRRGPRKRPVNGARGE